MALQLSPIGSFYICICTYKYLKEKTKRAQVKPTYGGKKKKRKRKRGYEKCRISNNCENIIRIC